MRIGEPGFELSKHISCATGELLGQILLLGRVIFQLIEFHLFILERSLPCFRMLHDQLPFALAHCFATIAAIGERRPIERTRRKFRSA